jgi:GYF domain 2
MSGTSGKIEWYLARDGQQHGPLTEDELDKFIELGHLKPTDLLWRAGFDDWRTAAQVFPPLPPAPQRPEPVPPAAPPASEPDPTVEAAKTQPAHQAVQPVAEPVDPTPAAGQHEPRQHNPRMANPRRQPAQQSRDAAFAASPSAVTQRPEHLAGMHERAGGHPAAHIPMQQPHMHAGPIGTAQPAAHNDFDEDTYFEDEPAGRGGWLLVAAALFVVVLLGAGGLFVYNNKELINKVVADFSTKTKTDEVAIVRAPTKATKEAATPVSPPASTPAAPAAVPSPTVTAALNQGANAPDVAKPKPLPELPILKSKLWQFAQREFGVWADKRLAEVRKLSAEDKPKEEANKHLVKSFVQFRRANAAAALAASPDQLAEVARAFVNTLQALTSRGSKACYAFISNGESTPEVADLYFEPSIGPKLEAQMLAIMKAVVSGKNAGTAERAPPTAADFNKLSAELERRGWSAADLKLFSDPNALSRAKPEVVCRLVTEWFATQTKLLDEKARDQLIAASLRPVIGG